MKNVYVKNNGKNVSVSVTDEMEAVLTETRRAIWRNEAKENYYREVSLDAMTDKDERTVSAELNPETIVIATEKRKEGRTKLAAALKTLTTEQARLVILFYVKNMPLNEIAEYYGVTYQAVQNRLKKILDKLKKFF